MHQDRDTAGFSASKRKALLCALVALLFSSMAALGPTHVQGDTYPRQNGLDAIHYVFRLTLNDSTDEIAGDATITLRIAAQTLDEAYLDLASAKDGKGMTATSVQVQGRPVRYSHQEDRLRIPFPAPYERGREITVRVQYHGIPAGGLRLIKNIHGERTAFSENWPNRARQWLPMIDHPYDKATGEFIVTAPSHYQVVANGMLVEEVDLAGDLRRTHWKQAVPISSWLYALGVARFAVHHYDTALGIPQQVWVFPQDRDKGYEVFELTGRRAFEFFSDWIGPYSYEKLAHVEAAGLGGGTEHASEIFYGEKGVTAGRAPVVHEVAHQWWGDSVTEKDWDDVWLSEGFATYFTHLYNERFLGREALVSGLKADINTIVQAQLKAPDQPVIHRNLADMSGVLNRFVYQKGGWILHMLRGLVGTDTFRSGLRQYYRRYQNSNASTGDFRQVMEQASGKDLGWFFDQWLTRPGMPALKGDWRYNAAARQIQIEIAQVQPGDPYRLPLEVGITPAGGRMRIESVELLAAQGSFAIPSEVEPPAVVLDPNTRVLLQAIDFKKR